MKRRRVCIDARLEPGATGGIAQFVQGLARGLGELDDGNEEYFFLTNQLDTRWIEDCMPQSGRLLKINERSTSKARLNSFLSSKGRITNLLNSVFSMLPQRLVPLQSEPEELRENEIDLMHFTFQSGFTTNRACLYHPHDLQHIHLPQFFTRQEIQRRQYRYKYFCEQANIVCVTSSWVKNDVAKNLNVSESKISVVPLAPTLSESKIFDSETTIDLLSGFGISGDYVFYPANTWEHKNHVALIKAAAIVNSTLDEKIRVVLTGQITDYGEVVKKEILRLGMEDEVHMLGYVSRSDMLNLYRNAKCAVIPSKFEAASFPLWDAFVLGVPAACSNVTSLPKQAGDAALLFNPENIDEIADCIKQIWTSQDVRDRLIAEGRIVVEKFKWKKTAEHMRALYREVLGDDLSKRDQVILNSRPIL